MLQEMRLALTLHRGPGHDTPSPTAAQILRMATEHGAATTPFAGRIGRLAPGLLADIVLLDWDSVTWPYQDPGMPLVDVLVRRAKAGAVETVLIGGRLVYHEGSFPRVDRQSVLEDIRRNLGRPDSPAEAAQRRLASSLSGPVRDFYKDWL
jgi:5-methylthioadenosine/S-adenosylhomocysteine deaminase